MKKIKNILIIIAIVTLLYAPNKASAAATVASSSQGYSISGSIVITAPTGIQVGDMLVMFCYGKWNTGFNASSSGFTQRITGNNGGEGMTVLSKVAVSADTSAANYTITAGQSEIMGCVMIRATGVTDTWTVTNSQVNIANGVFTSLDITPPAADSLIVMGAWNVPFTATAISGFAMVTSNPTWTIAQQIVGNNGNAIGSGGLAWATRTAVTSTGDLSITDPGTDQQAIAFALAPAVVGPANIKTYLGVATGSVKTLLGVAIASVKTKLGVN